MRVWLSAIGLFVLTNLVWWFSTASGKILQARDQDIVVWNAKHEAMEAGFLIGADGVILGDSQAMGGLLPERLQENTGLSFYNMALPANMPEGVEAQAELLERYAPQSTLWIVNVSPIFLFKSDVVRAFQTYARAELVRRSPWTTIGPKGLIDSPAQALHQLLLFVPLYRANDALSSFVSFDANGSPSHSSPVYERYHERYRANGRVLSILRQHRGWWTWKTTEISTTCEPPARLEKLPSRTAYERRIEAENSLRRFLIYAVRNPARRVILVQIPLSETWESSAAPDVYRRLDLALARVTDGVERVSVLPRMPRRSWSFHDWTHLSHCGALEFTDAVSQELIRLDVKKK